MPPPSDPSLLAHARAAVPAEHAQRPEVGDTLPGPQTTTKARLQDYAFLNGFQFVVGSRDNRPGRRRATTTYKCHHHGSQTRNIRKLTEETRKRKTTVRKLGCPCKVTTQEDRETGVATVTAATWEHSHGPHPDPLTLVAHRGRRPGFEEVLRLARSHVGIIPYNKSAEIMRRQGLVPLGVEEYYNLKRTVDGGATGEVRQSTEGPDEGVVRGEELISSPGDNQRKEPAKKVIAQ